MDESILLPTADKQIGVPQDAAPCSTDRSATITGPIKTESPYTSVALKYREAGLSVIPCGPGTKVPGERDWGVWKPMHGWQRYAERLPSEVEIDIWGDWDRAGVCLLMGGIGGLLGIDIDTDRRDIIEALERELAGLLICRKRGKRGYTAIVKAPAAFHLTQSKWNVDKLRVLDLLHTGRQMVMPPTIHPDTNNEYNWLTPFHAYDTHELPDCPEDIVERCSRAIAPFQNADDKRDQMEAMERAQARGVTMMEGGAEGRSINNTALANLPKWVMDLIPDEYLQATWGGFRVKPFWRGVTDQFKCSIHAEGIQDFAAEKKYTPIDLVMVVRNCSIGAAMDWLAGKLGIVREKDLPMSAEDNAIIERMGKFYLDKVAASAVATAEPKNDLPDGLPPHLQHPPGILGDIVRYMLASAQTPQPEMAVLAALALGSMAMGQLYMGPTRTRSALQLIGLARTGFGKGHPQKCIGQLLRHTEMGHTLGGSTIASGSAILSHLAQTGGHSFYMIDEVDDLMRAALAKGAQAHVAEIGTLITKLYSAADDPMFKGKDYADRKMRKTDEIAYPSLTLLGYTTPDRFYANLKGSDIASGFLNRMLIVQAASTRPSPNFEPEDITVIPASVAPWMKRIRYPGYVIQNRLGLGATPDSPVKVDYANDDARRALENFTQEVQDRADAIHAKGGGLEDVLARWAENAHRVALICAGSKQQGEQPPVVDLECAEWAVDFIKHCGEAMLDAASKRIFESEFDESFQRVKGYIFDHRDKGTTKRDLQQKCRAYRKLQNRDAEAVIARLESLAFIYCDAGKYYPVPGNS